MSNGQISIINSPALVWYWLRTLELFTFYFFLHFPTKFDAWKCWRCCIKYQHSGDQSQHFKYNIVNWCFVWFSNLMFALLQIRFKLSLLAILLWTKHVTGSQTFCFQKSSSKIARKDFILTWDSDPIHLEKFWCIPIQVCKSKKYVVRQERQVSGHLSNILTNWRNVNYQTVQAKQSQCLHWLSLKIAGKRGCF